MSKVIKIGLNTKDIDSAIREVEKYKQDFLRKVDVFRDRLAKEITDIAQSGFNSAMVDDILPGYGSSRSASVKVDFDSKGNITTVFTSGEDAIWVEFGSGVYHNGSVGSSPHPQGAKLGYTIGSYGKGYGKGNVWGYYTNPDEKTGLVLTHGTPATMPMYNAMKTVSAKVISIAREVFGA
jgi:hypothetical protein